MFTISTDSCVDKYKTYLKNNEVHCIVLKRLTNGVESAELFDSAEEYAGFYEELKQGALPTTSQLSEYEFLEFFREILEKCEGDIVHISLSSGLSGTCEGAISASKKLNSTLSGRKIFVVDSLSASHGMGMLLDRLIDLRNEGRNTVDAVRVIEDLRDCQQAWVVVGNLFHLKRGGRLSGIKAALGTLLAVKPIMTINDRGKLVIENAVKGKKRAVVYIADKMQSLGAKKEGTFYLPHSMGNEVLYKELEKEIVKRFPHAKIKKGIVGPVVGTHLGEGSVIVIFEGVERLKI